MNLSDDVLSMALDAYSLCPGGTGKRIKFCCGDFLGELQNIDWMFEEKQYVACLQHIEHLRQQPAHRDRQCLLAYQADLRRIVDQHEPAVGNVSGAPGIPLRARRHSLNLQCRIRRRAKPRAPFTSTTVRGDLWRVLKATIPTGLLVT